MAMDEDLSVFFNTDEFAVTATVDGNSVNGNKSTGVVEEGGVLRPVVTFRCDAADVAGVGDGDAVTLEAVSYTVAGPVEVENGIATLYLART